MKRVLRWTACEGGLEHAELVVGAAEIAVEGVVIGADAGQSFGCSYLLRCDAAWRVRAFEVHRAGGASLVLRGDGAGNWRDGAGRPLPALDGCIDVDLRCSPLTNTLPIRRLGAQLQQRRELRVAYVDPLQLGQGARAAAQAYTLLAPGRYRFEGLDSGFSAEIETDDEGLVLRYPGLFERAPS